MRQAEPLSDDSRGAVRFLLNGLKKPPQALLRDGRKDEVPVHCIRSLGDVAPKDETDRGHAAPPHQLADCRRYIQLLQSAFPRHCMTFVDARYWHLRAGCLTRMQRYAHLHLRAADKVDCLDRSWVEATDYLVWPH